MLIKALSPYVESLQKNAGEMNTSTPLGATSTTPTTSIASASGVPRTTGTAPLAPAQSAKKSFTMIVAASVAAVVIAVGGYAWYQKSFERAEAMRQAALLKLRNRQRSKLSWRRPKPKDERRKGLWLRNLRRRDKPRTERMLRNLKPRDRPERKWSRRT